MPCQPKTVSVMMAPANAVPICSEPTVTTGISALRKACFQMTRGVADPLGPRGTDVIRAQHIEHRRALIAGIHREGNRHQTQRRQQIHTEVLIDLIAERAGETAGRIAGGDQPTVKTVVLQDVVELDATDLEDHREAEQRQREHQERERGDDVVEPAVPLDGGQHARRSIRR